MKLGNWFEKKVKILQDKVTNLDNYRYGSDKYSIKWKKRDKTLKDLRVRGVDRIRELLKRADKSERVQNSPKYFIFDKKFQDLRDEISSIKKRLDRCFELHADKIQINYPVCNRFIQVFVLGNMCGVNCMRHAVLYRQSLKEINRRYTMLASKHIICEHVGSCTSSTKVYHTGPIRF